MRPTVTCNPFADPRVQEYARRLREVEFEQRLHFVLGGDGTMLKAMQVADTSTVFIGLNEGTLGYYMNDTVPYGELVARVQAGQFKEVEFPRLGAVIDVDVFQSTNDFYVERSSGQTCRFDFFVNEVMVAENVMANGVIVCTAVGSTGYNVSAGGPVLHPLLEALVVTVICPRKPVRPLVLPSTARVVVRVHDQEWRPVTLSGDGVAHRDRIPHAGVKFRLSSEKVRVGYWLDRDMTANLASSRLIA